MRPRGNTVPRRRRWWIAATVAAGIPGVVASAWAQQDVTHIGLAGEPAHARPASPWTQRALDCLDRGENATGPADRLAAYREGLQYAERAVAANDDDADAHFAVFANRGRIMMLDGVVPNPFNLYVINRELNRTLELDPNHTDALAAKGGMLRQLPRLLGGNLREAARYLRRAIELDPSAVGARVELAEIYRNLDEPEKSLALLREAAEVARRDGKQRQLAEIESQLTAFTGNGHEPHSGSRR